MCSVNQSSKCSESKTEEDWKYAKKQVERTQSQRRRERKMDGRPEQDAE